MKVNGNSNMVVYVTLYALVFGLSIWVLIADRESPTDWLAYAAMIGSVLAGAVKFAVQLRKRQRTA